MSFRVDLLFVRAEDPVAKAADRGLERLLLVTQLEIHGNRALTDALGFSVSAGAASRGSSFNLGRPEE